MWKFESAQAIVIAGGAVNVLLIGVKYYAAAYSGSTALLAEASHSLLDLLADAATFFAVRESAKGASTMFPFGRAKFESVCAVVIGFVLVTGGLRMASEIWVDEKWREVDTFKMWSPPESLPRSDPKADQEQAAIATAGEGHGEEMVALAAGLLSLVCKELLYRVTSHLGRVLGSVALISNAAHHRSDAFASLVAVAGVAGLSLGFPLLDPAAGLFVSGMLLHSGVEIGLTGLKPLVDAVDVATVRCLERTLRGAGFPLDDGDDDGDGERTKRSDAWVKRVDRVRARALGSGHVAVDLRVHVDGSLSLAQACEAADRVKHCLLSHGTVQKADQAHAPPPETPPSSSSSEGVPSAEVHRGVDDDDDDDASFSVAVLEVSVQLAVWQSTAANQTNLTKGSGDNHQLDAETTGGGGGGGSLTTGMRHRKSDVSR